MTDSELFEIIHGSYQPFNFLPYLSLSTQHFNYYNNVTTWKLFLVQRLPALDRLPVILHAPKGTSKVAPHSKSRVVFGLVCRLQKEVFTNGNSIHSPIYFHTPPTNHPSINLTTYLLFHPSIHPTTVIPTRPSIRAFVHPTIYPPVGGHVIYHLYVLILFNPTIYLACSNNKYGKNCGLHCQCYQENTESCDPVSGQCNCKAGWTGDYCTEGESK